MGIKYQTKCTVSCSSKTVNTYLSLEVSLKVALKM